MGDSLGMRMGKGMREDSSCDPQPIKQGSVTNRESTSGQEAVREVPVRQWVLDSLF